MSAPLRLVLLLHNHQPVGNFDHVIEQAYQDSYKPFLDVFERFEGLRIGLHTSGPLMEWFEQHHPEYLDRLAQLVQAGRVEIVGGAFYEPILTMIPPVDRIGQISSYTSWLENRLGGRVQGMWIPERVWEPALVSDIAAAGIRYSVLDDFHFKNGGLTDDQLHGHFVTEDRGRILSVFPGSERLRYLIPFAQPHETIDYLRGIHEQHENAVVVFGDDGEKFGVWPDTKAHVYEHGWLEQFFAALSENSSWLDVTTPGDALINTPTLGRAYVPEASYREMTEWALPAERIAVFEDAKHALEESGQWDSISAFVRGGNWRNFKVKYPETNEMYTRMLQVSRRLQQALETNPDSDLIEAAQRELYRGQCNCSYWHGAFGGVYLPHLRHAIYNHIIAADNLLDQNEGRGWENEGQDWVELTAEDYNLDGRGEVRLASNRLAAYFAPSAGGQMYELDVRPICLNALATLARRPEGYHRKVLAGPSGAGDDVASIHERVVFKQEGLDQRIQYDDNLRKSLQDRFFPADVSLEQVVSGDVEQLGDFLSGSFETKLRRSADRMQVQMTRDGRAGDFPLRITKGITLEAGSSQLEIAYLLEGLPTDQPLHFASEFNFAGLPGNAEGRYFRTPEGEGIDHLGCQLDLDERDGIGLVDDWLGFDVGLQCDRPTRFWTFPIETVSQSEGGFELVHQSVVVMPHWIVKADPAGRWSVVMRLSLDTSAAESRRQPQAELATV